MKRRAFLENSGRLAACVLALEAKAKPRNGDAPNIVFLFSDEHRYQSMPFTEMPELVAPNMVRLAKEGKNFSHCISNNPVCVPHRSMLMTGMWCYATLMLENNGKMPDENNVPTLGKVFTKAGYDTCYTGKWHIGMDEKKAGFNWHFSWKSTNEHWDSETAALHHGEDYKPYKKYNATGMTDQALEFLDANAKTKNPFFLMVSWNPPHAVFTDPPPDKLKLYEKIKLSRRPNSSKDKEESNDPSYYGYHAHISAIDDEIGRILDKLAELGVAENTVVIYSADHGSMMNSHGKGNKRHAYEESIRIPFLVRWPKRVKAGSVCDRLIGSIDMFPTLCGVAGIPVPYTCHGEDHVANITGDTGPDPDSQFIMHISNKKTFDHQRKNPNFPDTAPYFRGVRSRTHTYTVGTEGEWQLYDNIKDPYQLKNEIDNPAYADIKRQCRAQLDDWLAKAEYAFMDKADRDRFLKLPLHERIKLQSVEALTIHREGTGGGKAPSAGKHPLQQLPDYYFKADLPDEKLKILAAERERIFSLEKIDEWLKLRKQKKTDQYKTMLKVMSDEFKEVTNKHLNASEHKRLSDAKK